MRGAGTAVRHRPDDMPRHVQRGAFAASLSPASRLRILRSLSKPVHCRDLQGWSQPKSMRTAAHGFLAGGCRLKKRIRGPGPRSALTAVAVRPGTSLATAVGCLRGARRLAGIVRGQSQSHPAASSAAPSRRRSAKSAEGRSRPRRRVRASKEDVEAPLTLLPGRARPMAGDEERQLVEALAELLVEWIEARPERLPAGLRTGRGCDLDGCSRAKEQP
jgi:hypothetical protein